MKMCNRCLENKSLEDFATRSDRGKLEYQSSCRDCHKIYRREHYLKNKQKYIEKAKIWTRKQKREIFNYLLNHPCVDCGESNPIVLEFDHVRGKKEFNISQAVGRLGVGH